MTTAGAAGHPGRATAARTAAERRVAADTKASFRTTEFYAYIAMAAVVVITAISTTTLNTEQTIRYLTLLTIGYMLSRGFAKSGHSRAYDEGA
jgi:hypothetical protein